MSISEWLAYLNTIDIDICKDTFSDLIRLNDKFFIACDNDKPKLHSKFRLKKADNKVYAYIVIENGYTMLCKHTCNKDVYDSSVVLLPNLLLGAVSKSHICKSNSKILDKNNIRKFVDVLLEV